MSIYDILIFIVHVSSGLCYVGYDLFPGFNEHAPNDNLGNTSFDQERTNNDNMTSTVVPKLQFLQTGLLTKPVPTTILSTPTTAFTPSTIKYIKFNCSEDEKPFNIGTYEVPTQRDLVLLIRKTLIKSFNSYQQKAMYLLKDIRGATQSTSAVADKCRVGGGDDVGYKKCVKRVSVKSQVITKSLVTSLERQRLDVDAFIQGTICEVKEMKADPLQLLKTLAMEEASLEFALPGFLRLLGACIVYCDRTKPKKNKLKPLRHMSDQDLVVKHFLTKKNYLQLLRSFK